MINFREIFNINYSYVGLIIIGILMIILVLLDKKESIRVMGKSFFVAGIFLFLIYLFGNIIISNFSYKFFIEVISDSFFSSVIVFAVVSVVFGGIALGAWKYIN